MRSKETINERNNAMEMVDRASEMHIESASRKAKLKHFGNMSIHFESCTTKCFIEIVKLEPKK